MEQSNSMENLHFPMSTGNVRNLARLFEGNSAPRKPNFTLTRSKSKSYSSIIIKQEAKEIVEKERLSFRDIYSKFESGNVSKKPLKRMSSVNSLECLKLQEIKEISRKTDEIVDKMKGSKKVVSNYYITSLNDIVEMLLQIGQMETDGNSTLQTEKLATLQVLQKCYSQLRGKLEHFLIDDSGEEEEQKISIRSSIERWESIIESRTHFEAPNYSTHFTIGISKQGSGEKSHETNINGEVVKCTDIEDDSKLVEHVKVQNLKDIWERRGSQDVCNEESHMKESEASDVNVASISTIVKQFEEFAEQSVQIEEEANNHRRNESLAEEECNLQIEEEFERIAANAIQESSQVELFEEEENEELISTQLKFLDEEREHTDYTYSEKEIINSQVVVEYLSESLTAGTIVQNLNQGEEREIKILDVDELREEGNNGSAEESAEDAEMGGQDAVTAGVAIADSKATIHQSFIQIENISTRSDENEHKIRIMGVNQFQKEGNKELNEGSTGNADVVANLKETTDQPLIEIDTTSFEENEQEIKITYVSEFQREARYQEETSEEWTENTDVTSSWENEGIEMVTTSTSNEDILSKNKDPKESSADFLNEERKNTENTDMTPPAENEETEKAASSTSDGNVLSKNKNPRESSADFLNEERKNNDLQLEDIDPQFGPPTGIIPDPNQKYEQVPIVEENVADDEFVVICEKQESCRRNAAEEVNECHVKGENVQQMAVAGSAPKEESYLIIDNRSVEEIEQAIKNKEENVLVNGDKV